MCLLLLQYLSLGTGGWGSKCQNHNPGNPGCYRDANWDKCFAPLLVVGGTYAITFTSSQAVEDYLPDGSPSQQLSANYEDPESNLGIFAGQLTALSLNVGFDFCNEDFSASGSFLGDQVYCAPDGLCAGMTVSEILSLGLEVLGGPPGDPADLGRLNTCVSIINENYVDGMDKGNLCPNPSLSCAPSLSPSTQPSSSPTPKPTPIIFVTPAPSSSPSAEPSSSPSSKPSVSSAPSTQPSPSPTPKPNTPAPSSCDGPQSFRTETQGMYIDMQSLVGYMRVLIQCGFFF